MVEIPLPIIQGLCKRNGQELTKINEQAICFEKTNIKKIQKFED
jgi:hypothetical protein